MSGASRKLTRRGATRERSSPLSEIDECKHEALVHVMRGESSCVVCGRDIRIGDGAKLRIRRTLIEGAYLLTTFCGRCYGAAN